MKLKGTVALTIIVSGKDGRECGSRERQCRFQGIPGDWCVLFKRKLEYSVDHNGFPRCKECLRVFK